MMCHYIWECVGLRTRGYNEGDPEFDKPKARQKKWQAAKARLRKIVDADEAISFPPKAHAASIVSQT